MSEFRKSIKWFASYRTSRRHKYQLTPTELVPMLDELRSQLVAVRKIVRKRKSSGADIGKYYHPFCKMCLDSLCYMILYAVSRIENLTMPPGGLKQLIDAVVSELGFVDRFQWHRNLDKEIYER